MKDVQSPFVGNERVRYVSIFSRIYYNLHLPQDTTKGKNYSEHHRTSERIKKFIRFKFLQVDSAKSLIGSLRMEFEEEKRKRKNEFVKMQIVINFPISRL